MFNKKSVLLASVCACMIAGTVPVLADGGNTYINGSYGKQDFDGDRLMQSEGFYSIGLEHRFNSGWGAELFWMDSSPSRNNNAGELDLEQYGIDGLYYFKSDANNAYDSIQPYGAFGVAEAEFKDASGRDKETQVRAGLGFRVILSDHWSAKADARLLYSSEANALDNTLSVGLSYAFNSQAKVAPPAPVDSDNDGVPNTADNCPGTPVGTPVDSTGCARDGDNDGVPNATDECPNSPAGSQVDATGCGLDTDGDKITDDKDNCPATPAGADVDANGCPLDFDKDGVADYKDNCPETPMGRAVDAQGCKFVLTSSEQLILKINFASNSSVITDAHYPELEKVATFLKKYGDVDTVIEGHSDSRGEADYNAKLSQARAESVRTVLIERFGIEADRITAKGYGESRPVATNMTKAGRLENRRVIAVMKAEISE